MLKSQIYGDVNAAFSRIPLRTSQPKDSDFRGKEVRAMNRCLTQWSIYRYMGACVELYGMAKKAI